MLVTTAPGATVLAKTTTGPTMSASADPPAADPPAPGEAVVTTSLSTMSGGGGGSPTDLSQFNPGAQDLATPAVSSPMTTDITTTTGSQILGVNDLVLPNVTTSGEVSQAATSGAVPDLLSASLTAAVTTPGEVIATSGGSSLTGGATGRNMPECMAAWDTATHITKPRWRQICARTLIEPHI